MQLQDNLSTDSGWNIREHRFDPGQLVTNGSKFMTGNGYLGYRGTFPEWTKSEYVGCVVTDTYDNADGTWTELCTVPNGLFARAELVDGAREEGASGNSGAVETAPPEGTGVAEGTPPESAPPAGRPTVGAGAAGAAGDAAAARDSLDSGSQGIPLSLLPGGPATVASYRRELDFRYGVQSRAVTLEVPPEAFSPGGETPDAHAREHHELDDAELDEPARAERAPGASVSIRDERFASYEDLHLICARYELRVGNVNGGPRKTGPKESSKGLPGKGERGSAEEVPGSGASGKRGVRSGARVRLVVGIDGEVWSLNGEHFSSYESSAEPVRETPGGGQAPAGRAASGERPAAAERTPAGERSAAGEGAAAGRLGAAGQADPEANPDTAAGTAGTGENACDNGLLTMRVVTQERGVPVCVGSSIRMTGAKPVEAAGVQEERGIYRVYVFELEPGEQIAFEQHMAVYSGNDTADPDAAVRRSLAAARRKGYEELLAEHRRVWDRMWERTDVTVEGDPAAQAVLRYCQYQNFIATPRHADHLPIGARGLSCQAYQGAAFWDQEIFNVPVYVHTEPEVARRILTYRHRTLAGAREKARALGYHGAFYAWVSGDTGREICPSFFFRDVLTGRPIRNHFNDWQIHVSPDIAYAVWRYYVVTGDFEFMTERGAEILFEVARFLWSRAHWSPARRRYEYIRLLGPDEYHENVDNNPFTCYQARYALRAALRVLALLAERAPERLAELRSTLDLRDAEIEEWRDMAEWIYVKSPDPETSLIEQFDGFFALEDTRPAALEERLLDPGEYWGWPNGVAVHTQVSKQADVAQLFALHPAEFDTPTMEANYDYYEPRTQHGSSLSFSVYAMVAAWIGRVDAAYDYFMRSCTVDLFDISKAVSGGTFIGGIHTAASGVAWQVAVFGFGGVRIEEDRVVMAPRLPAGWRKLAFPLVVRGRRIRATVTGEEVAVRAAPENSASVSLEIDGQRLELEPGATVGVRRASRYHE